MSDPKICLIAAMGENFAIGKDQKLLWDLPEDMKWFRTKTRGNVVIMGRKTLQALPNSMPLPNRPNIVISRHPPFLSLPELYWAENLESALALARKIAQEKNQKEIFVMGGGEIYTQSLDLADRLYLTCVEDSPEGDAFFPQFNKNAWQEKTLATHEAVDNQPRYSIYQYDRLRA